MKFLLIDIGAGTMDVLYYDDDSNLHYKAVVISPVRTVAEDAANSRGNLLVTGGEMGGGPVSEVLRRRALEADVAMTASAAATIHHNPEKVIESGIRIIDVSEEKSLSKSGRYTSLVLEDLQLNRLEQIVIGFGVPFAFDVVAICAQDHGVPPDGVSHLDYRHNLFKEKLNRAPAPYTLLYRSEELPATFNRLSTIANSAAALPAQEIFLMDSGMAAILGASLDTAALGHSAFLVLDVATSHTVAAVIAEGEIAAFFEYHTRDINRDSMAALLPNLADGKMSHQSILAEGGHGAYIRKVVGFQNVGTIIATGPKRGLIHGIRFPVVYGAPLGDNMMTGTVGLLEAVHRRKNMESMASILF